MEHRMNCSEAQNLIPQYLSGELDEDAGRELEEHITGCPDCQEGMRREQSLRHLICQSADDPPEDYWDDYNDELRSRIRGAVAMSWRMGCLPAGLWGLIGGGLIAGPLWWLSFGDGLGGIHPYWLRWLLEIALVVIIGGGMSIISGLVIRCAMRGLPKYEREERGLERIISRNPRYRAAFVAFFMLVALGTPALLAGFTFWIGWYLPTWARFSFAVVVFLGFAGILPGYYQYLRGFISGSQIPGRSRKYRLWHSALIYLACIAMLASVTWNMHVYEHLDAPRVCRDEADATYRSGDAGRAISLLRSCIRKYGETYRVLKCYEYLGRIYAETGKEEQSLVIFHEGIKTYKRLLLHPKYSYSKDDQLDLLYDAAQLYIDLGQNREAYRTYTSMLRLSPNDPGNMHSVAQGYVAVGHKDEGKAIYARIIIEFPRSPAAGWSRDELKRMAQGKSASSNCQQEAESAYESGDVDSAVSILRSGIKNYGNSYHVLECYHYLGRIYVETGKWEQSRVIFHEGIKTYERLLLHPKYSYSKDEQLDFLGDAAQLYIDLYRNREAYQLYSTRLHLSPNDPENMYSVAQGYVVVGHKGEARALYTRVILEFPNSYEATWAQQDIKALH